MQKVRSGEPVRIRAGTWNSFIDAANYVKDREIQRGGKPFRSGVTTGIVLVQNSEEELRERFSALVLDDIAVSPAVNEADFIARPPVFIGVRMTEEREGKPYVILLAPLKPGEIGRAMLMGIVTAQVKIEDADDEYAVPEPGSSTGALISSSSGVARILWKAGGSNLQWCVLQLGGAGSGSGGEKAYMCKVVSGSVKEGYKVDVYPNGREDSGAVERAVLYLPDLALDSDLPVGTWIIGHKCALKATGGDDV